MDPQIRDPEARLCRDGSDPVPGGPLVRPFQDSIYMDDSARPDRRERVFEVVECRMREVKDDAVDRRDPF